MHVSLPGNVFIVYKWEKVSEKRRNGEKEAATGRKAAFYFLTYVCTKLYSSHYCHRTRMASFTCFKRHGLPESIVIQCFLESQFILVLHGYLAFPV